ncbi:hypothetical protein NQ318_010717 [Aromia moschata]|uniref:Uncharacterized protein n=1 Tax=Aromia moschata TaxID=1265417 RepID=A0AAV8YL55_9CUCU|nr:hypothetical protein NQ318_010717 [Aromia moschata]
MFKIIQSPGPRKCNYSSSFRYQESPLDKDKVEPHVGRQFVQHLSLAQLAKLRGKLLTVAPAAQGSRGYNETVLRKPRGEWLPEVEDVPGVATSSTAVTVRLSSSLYATDISRDEFPSPHLSLISAGGGDEISSHHSLQQEWPNPLPARWTRIDKRMAISYNNGICRLLFNGTNYPETSSGLSSKSTCVHPLSTRPVRRACEATVADKILRIVPENFPQKLTATQPGFKLTNPERDLLLRVLPAIWVFVGCSTKGCDELQREFFFIKDSKKSNGTYGYSWADILRFKENTTK